MKRILMMVIVIIVVIAGVYFVSIYSGKGPLAYKWSVCENGFYSKYPVGLLDADATYYDSNNNVVGSCGFWTSENPTCREIEKNVGKCTKVSFWKILFTNKLGLYNLAKD